MRHPLPLLTLEVPAVPLSATGTLLLLQDLHAAFSNAEQGWLMREARRKGVRREFDEYAEQLPSVLDNAALLLRKARELGLEVHHLRMGRAPGDPPAPLLEAMGWGWDPEGPDGALPEALRPLPGEFSHRKTGWGALSSASLRARLDRLDPPSVVLCGLPFDFGVQHSCYQLADIGVRVVVASDATAAVSRAAEAATRGNLGHGTTKMRSTAELIDLLARLPGEGLVQV